MTRIRLNMLATFVACLLLGIRTCWAQFAIATSSASAGGAVASAGGVSAVAQLPQFGFGSNGFGFNGFGLSTNLNPFNNFPSNHRGNRPGNGRPAPPPPMQWGNNWNGGSRQPAPGWGNWESQGGNGGCGFNCGQTAPGWNGGGGNWEHNSGWGGGGSPAPPGWGNGGRQPPGWGNGGRQPPGWQNGGRQPPGWQNGDRQPPGWQNGGRQPPGRGGGNGPNPTVPSNGNNNGQPRPVNPQPPNNNGNANPPTPKPTPPTPTEPLPTTDTSPGTLIVGKNPPPLISPTPPPNQGDTLIVGTNRPPLVPPPQPTPPPTTHSHSIELSRLRHIIFPSSLQYLPNPIEESPDQAIDIRRR